MQARLTTDPDDEDAVFGDDAYDCIFDDEEDTDPYNEPFMEGVDCD